MGLCFGNKSRQPFGHSADIPKCRKRWPCEVKTHFRGQHPRPGRMSIDIDIGRDIVSRINMTSCHARAAVSEPARQQFDFEKPGKSGSAAKWSCRVPSPLVGTNHPNGF